MAADKLKDPATGVFHEYQAWNTEFFNGPLIQFLHLGGSYQ
jgi:hypothetical protein